MFFVVILKFYRHVRKSRHYWNYSKVILSFLPHIWYLLYLIILKFCIITKKKSRQWWRPALMKLFLLFSFSSLTLAMVMMMMLMMFMCMKAIYKWKKFYMCAFTHYLFMCVQLGAILVYAWRTFLILFSSFAFSLLERTEKRAKR